MSRDRSLWDRIFWGIVLVFFTWEAVYHLITDPVTWLISFGITALIFAPIVWLRRRRKHGSPA